MNRNYWYGAIVVILLAILALMLWNALSSPRKENDQTENNTVNQEIQVNAPLADSIITSPVAISGQAVGSWYFEASFPIELLDSNGQVIGQTTAQAQGDWMTSDPVPFTASLTFPAQPAGSSGTLMFENDNPSGDPAKAKSYSIPVKF